MARLALGAVACSRLGVDVTAAALTPLGANTGVAFLNSGGMAVVVNNGGASPITVTENIGAKIEGQGVTAPTISIPAGKTWIVGPFHPRNFLAGDGSGQTQIDITPQTSVGVGLISLTPIQPS